MPDIVTDLHTSLGTAAWTVSGYLLGLAAGPAATPWLARRFGTLPVYDCALLLAAVPAAGALAALTLRGGAWGGAGPRARPHLPAGARGRRPCPPAPHHATMGEAANDAG